MKRTPMKRSRDPVTPELRRFVLERDRECVLVKRDAFHQCHDQWGTWHAPHDLNRLSVEHVKSELRMGVRAPSDPAHLVALCHGANVAVPSKDERAWMREYLLGVNA